MTTITTPILPVTPTFAKVKGEKALNKEAICIFAATGFFLDMDTYWTNEVVLPAGHICTIDADGFLIDYKPWFNWHHSPRAISFETALEEFTTLFEDIVKTQTQDQPVILPLSGGLDSRSQAVALKRIGAEVQSYSYQFVDGYAETKIAASIAKACGFPFQQLEIPKGYLWDTIDELAAINGCYSDFCAPRQMAVLEALTPMTGDFSLGHWGDVLFDDMGVASDASLEVQAAIILKKICKRGGLEFADSLWNLWDLEGDFKHYLLDRITTLLQHINITEDANAQIRAFKSLYWAPRWTSVNLAVFEKAHHIHLPYYDDRMCAFICSLPESYLAGRRLQIAYIKQQNPKVAKIPWQDHRPFNLYTYPKNKVPYNLPYRIINKAKRRLKSIVGQSYVQRNWELQFLGAENMTHLETHILSEDFLELIPKSFRLQILEQFKTENALENAHAINMLLVLQMWFKNNAK
ncbi:asparagine synthase-related protein [Lacinutrix undariae]